MTHRQRAYVATGGAALGAVLGSLATAVVAWALVLRVARRRIMGG
jgi:hypothetical protein